MEVEEGGGEFEVIQPPPGMYPRRLSLRARLRRRGLFALNRYIWGAAVLSGASALIIYSLFLAHCTNSQVAGMYLFELTLGSESVQVAYLGMCVSGKHPALTFNQDPSSILHTFNTTANTDLGQLLIAGRDLQSQITMAFVFPLAVIVLWGLWHIGLADILRKATSMRGNMLVPRIRQRIEWRTWWTLLILTGLPAVIVCFGSAWSVMTAMQTVVSLWGNLAAVGSPVVTKGNSVETAHWAAAVLALFFGAHTARMCVETRQVLNRRGLLITTRESEMDNPPEDPEMGMMPGMFPGTNMPMPEGAVM